MADYPSIEIDTQGSKESWMDQRLVTRTRAGGPKVRLLGEAKKRAFMISHRGIADSDKATLEAFYDANRDSDGFNLTWFGIVYTVIFGDEKGIDFTPLSGSQWDAALTLLEA